MNYFTADLHFNDAPTLSVDHRPFKTPEEFDDFIINLWNNQAGKGDTIYVLGDFVDCDGFGHESWMKSVHYPKQINAKVILIIGNNEQRVIKNYFNDDFEAFRKHFISCGFTEVYQNYEMTIAGERFYLTHKPIDCKFDMLNLFGHMHRGGGIYKPFGFNIGCDLNHFFLYSEANIADLLKMKKAFWEKDKNINLWTVPTQNNR